PQLQCFVLFERCEGLTVGGVAGAIGKPLSMSWPRQCASSTVSACANSALHLAASGTGRDGGVS
ncbi:MAG: hypothetical protein ACPIOQ_10630, partial [Promethearchaeia archaeon]